MATEHVVDAHTLVWYLEGSTRLGTNARTVMRNPGSVLMLPVIALAEACWTVERGRSTIPSVGAMLADVDADPRLTILPLDRETLDLSLTLTAVGEMHDRLIVAAALLRQRSGASVSILMRDTNITASGLVSVIW